MIILASTYQNNKWLLIKLKKPFKTSKKDTCIYKTDAQGVCVYKKILYCFIPLHSTLLIIIIFCIMICINTALNLKLSRKI
jgi:hypothetical protein